MWVDIELPHRDHLDRARAECCLVLVKQPGEQLHRQSLLTAIGNAVQHDRAPLAM